MRWLVVASLLLLQTTPSIAVTPNSGQPGSSFAVTGSAFAAGERVKILWDGANLGATLKVGPDGTFRYSGAVPSGAAPGSHSVEAQGVGGGTDVAKATFTVVDPSVTSTVATSTTTSTPTTSTTVGVTVTTSPPTTASGSSNTSSASGSSNTSTASPSTTVVAETTTTGRVGAVPGATAGTGGMPTSTVSGATPPAGPEGGSRGMGLLLLVLAVLVVGGGIAFVAWRRSRPEPFVEAEPDGGAVADEVATVQAPPAAADLYGSDGEWTRHMIDLAPPGEVEGVIGNGGGLFAFGRVTVPDGDGQAAVWNSSDGITWNHGATLGAGSARLAVPWQEGLLVATVHEGEGLAGTTWWRSGDAGTWDRLTGEAEDSLAGVSLEGGATLGESIVAWGRNHDGNGVWCSRDGSSWQESALRGGMDLIAPLDGRFVAFGRRTDARPVVAWSFDGLSWDELSEDTQFVFEGAWVAALVSFDGGMVAAGTDIMRGRAATWVSDDGHRWLRTPFEPAEGTHITDLVVVDGRLLAVGGIRARGRRRVALWESRDAVSWEPVAASELFADAAARSAQEVDGSVVVCGAQFAEGDEAQHEPIPVTWRSQVLRTDEPLPAKSLAE